MSRLPVVGLSLGLLFLVGCMKFDAAPAPAAKTTAPAAENSGKGIIGKKTQDIGEYDSNKANQVVSDQKIHASDPITGPLSAYGPILENAAILKIKHDIDIFEASESRYPTYQEFMDRIIKENNTWLPVLPFKGRYMYDVAKHELLVVRDIENADKASQ